MGITSLWVLLQVNFSDQIPAEISARESYFGILMKGGWIMVPLFLLSLIAVYVIIERWLEVKRADKSNRIWFPHASALIRENKIEEALYASMTSVSPSAKVAETGLKLLKEEMTDIEEEMQAEARQQIALLEDGMNYLGIISSIAPMLGFLGTIFGVIKIFYNISVTNNFDIATISDGLYQKMICSGAGLLVGVVAYSGYYLINGKIDKIIVQMDKENNEILRLIRHLKKNGK